MSEIFSFSLGLPSAGLFASETSFVCSYLVKISSLPLWSDLGKQSSTCIVKLAVDSARDFFVLNTL